MCIRHQICPKIVIGQSLLTTGLDGSEIFVNKFLMTNEMCYVKLIAVSVPLPFSPSLAQCISDNGPREDVPVSETDINLKISFSEQAASLKDHSVEKVLKGKEDDPLLPVGASAFFRFKITFLLPFPTTFPKRYMMVSQKRQNTLCIMLAY